MYESVHDRIKKIPEKSAQEAIIHYHQPSVTPAAASNGATANGPLKGVSLRSAPEERISPGTQAAQANTGPPAASNNNSKFSSTQAQIKAAMEAQEAAEQAAKQERIRIRQQHLQQRQTQSQILPARQFAVPQSTSMTSSLSANASTSPLMGNGPAPLGGNTMSARSDEATVSMPPSQNSSPTRPLAQSVHTSPAARSADQAFGVRPQPQSPFRSQVRTLPEDSRNPHDPLSPGTSGHMGQGNAQNTTVAPSTTTLPGIAPPQMPSLHDPRMLQGQAPASMTQSAFLPGRGANAARPAADPLADRKRADARKAASLLAGAF